LWNPDSGKVLLVESRIVGFGIWNLAQRISLAVKCKCEENCAFDDKSTIFDTEIIDIIKNIF